MYSTKVGRGLINFRQTRNKKQQLGIETRYMKNESKIYFVSDLFIFLRARVINNLG